MPGNLPDGSRLDSWKEIAVYLNRQVRTVQLWEKNEGLPVHRHGHKKRGTVYAFKPEIDAWWMSRRAVLEPEGAELRPPRRRLAIVAGALAVPILAGAVSYAVLRRPAVRTAEPRIVPLTSYPGTETGPSFSPDGSQVAFAWKRDGREDFDLYVKMVGSDNPLQLTNTPEWEVGPAWSPDGRAIAFYRSRREGGSQVYTVSPLGGPERLVAELDGKGIGCWWPTPHFTGARLSWSPDGKWLAVEGLQLISVSTGEKRTLTSSPGEWEADSDPAFSPDGQSVAFLRSRRSGVKDLYVISSAGGEPRRLTSEDRFISGVFWTTDGREIVYSSSATKWAESASLWRVSVSGGSPRRFAAGRENAWDPSISRQGNRLAFTRRAVDVNIWRLEASGAGGFQKPTRLIASTQVESAPVFSPDGKRIAFSSNRSGTLQVWVCDRDGSHVDQLTSFPEPGAALSTWSPDGRYIAFSSSGRGNGDIYVIAAQGGAPRQLTAESSTEGAPNWSRNGRWVYFASNRTGRLEIWKVPAEGGTAVQVTKKGGHRMAESYDGQFVYYEKWEPPSYYDVWKVPVDGGEETPVLENLRSRWALGESGLYFFEQEQAGERAGTWLLKFFDFATGRKKPAAVLGGTPLVGQKPNLSADGRTFLYTQLDSGETDLMMLENFR